MTITFRPALRANVPLLISLAGGTGSGKTMSAMLIAKGLAAGQPFYGLDTENGRMLHYADDFDFLHGEIRAPFRPDCYADAIDGAIKDSKQQRPVVVVDSFSHEHAGEGGLLDWHDEELQRMAGDDWKKRKAMTFAAWIAPKQAHKAMVNRLLQVDAHLILCFRAQQAIEIVKVNGETVVRPKESLVGADGWIPVSERTLPYEMTMSFLLTADAPGVPKPIKLQSQHRPLVPLDQPLTEDVGRKLAEWATGATAAAPSSDGDALIPTSWDALKAHAAAAGIPQNAIADTARDLFPSRKPSDLSPDDFAAFWDALRPVPA